MLVYGFRGDCNNVLIAWDNVFDIVSPNVDKYFYEQIFGKHMPNLIVTGIEDKLRLIME